MLASPAGDAARSGTRSRSPSAIVALLAIVAFSYRQTIHAYPSGGGAYIVAAENLGDAARPDGGGGALVDYILTVAVSIAAGVAAITSAFRAAAALHGGALCVARHRPDRLRNLRGIKESGTIFAIPTYLFIGSILRADRRRPGAVLLADPAALVAPERPRIAIGDRHQALTLVPAPPRLRLGLHRADGRRGDLQRHPRLQAARSRNAATTLTWMAAILGTLFVGVTVLAYLYRRRPLARRDRHPAGRQGRLRRHRVASSTTSSRRRRR